MADARIVGRYELHDVFASGGMAQVHFGRLEGAAGFRRIVAIKRLHAAYAQDPAFRAMLADEARLVTRVRHANVAAIVDVLDEDDELSLVLEYVNGESLARLALESRTRGIAIPAAVAASIVVGILRGLHAAHEATDASGAPLGIVHRDVSPQNVVVGVDGTARVIDFGVAKALGRAQSTRHGEIKGKAGYMAPEQVRGDAIDRRADIFAAGIVAWELFTGQRLFEADSSAAAMMRVLEHTPPPPSDVATHLPKAVDAVVVRALMRSREERYSTAADMADALEASVPLATTANVSAWVLGLAGDALRARDDQMRVIEAAAPIPSIATIPVATESAAIAPPPANAARGGIALLFAPLIVVGLVGAAAFATRVPHARTGSPGSTGPETNAASIATTAATIATIAATAAPSVTTINAPDAATVATTAPAASPAPGSAESTIGVPRTRAKPPRSSRGSKAECTPPYTIDRSGFHVMKPECL